MSDVLVSIVLPAYNRERYVGEAIESVLAQTFSSWELIVVDDGSIDMTAAVVERYRAAHPHQITCIRQNNAGVTVARNRAIRASRGVFIAFIDSDDAWHPAKLARQVALANSAADFSFLYTGYEIVDADGAVRRTVRPDRRFAGHIAHRLWEPNEILGPTLLIPRDKFFAIGLFDEQLRAAENLDARLKLARLGPVHYVDAALYRYRRHADSLTAQPVAVVDQLRTLIERHFQEPLDAQARRLREQALASYFHRLGDVQFTAEDYRSAMASYVSALTRRPGRKRELTIKALRCLLGRRGNALLRRIKASGQIGASHRSLVARARS